ncbi:MAG: hypothetical protein AB8B48_11800 [Pseudomonadales bacterium]
MGRILLTVVFLLSFPLSDASYAQSERAVSKAEEKISAAEKKDYEDQVANRCRQAKSQMSGRGLERVFQESCEESATKLVRRSKIGDIK